MKYTRDSGDVKEIHVSFFSSNLPKYKSHELIGILNKLCNFNDSRTKVLKNLNSSCFRTEVISRLFLSFNSLKIIHQEQCHLDIDRLFLIYVKRYALKFFTNIRELTLSS